MSTSLDAVLLSETRGGIGTEAGHRHALDRYYAAPLDRLGLAHFYDLPAPPSLGLAALGTHLMRQGLRVALFENFLNDAAQRGRLEEALRARPAVVGLSTTHLPDVTTLWTLVRWVRELATDSLIVLGGPNAERSAALQSLADVTVLGPGEETLARIVRAAKAGWSLETIPGIVINRGSRLTATPRASETTPDRFQAPDWSLSGPRYGSCLPIEASKGCRFNCAFCSFPDRGRQRMRPIPAVVEEMLLDRDVYGASILRFVDANLTSWPEWTEELCRAIVRAGAAQPWSCFARVDDFTKRPGLAASMREAGCVWIYLGLESGSDTVLRAMHKGYTTRDIRAGMSHLRDGGLRTHANFVVGFPGETAATLDETLELAGEVGLDTANFPVLVIPEGSDAPIALRREQFGLRGRHERWSHATMSHDEALRQADRCLKTVWRGMRRPLVGCESDIVYYLMGAGLSSDESLDAMRAFRDFHRGLEAGDDGTVTRALAAVAATHAKVREGRRA